MALYIITCDAGKFLVRARDGFCARRVLDVPDETQTDRDDDHGLDEIILEIPSKRKQKYLGQKEPEPAPTNSGDEPGSPDAE